MTEVLLVIAFLKKAYDNFSSGKKEIRNWYISAYHVERTNTKVNKCVISLSDKVKVC